MRETVPGGGAGRDLLRIYLSNELHTSRPHRPSASPRRRTIPIIIFHSAVDKDLYTNSSVLLHGG